MKYFFAWFSGMFLMVGIEHRNPLGNVLLGCAVITTLAALDLIIRDAINDKS